MRTEGRNVLSAVAMMAIAIGASVVPRSIAYVQAGPAFEVSLAGGRNSMAGISRTPLRIAFHAMRLGDIMAFAYELPLDRIERRPQWMYDDLYAVAVTTAAPAALPEQKLMLQKLLEERFGLVVHRVSYASPVYFLLPGAKVNLTETKDGDASGMPEFRTTVQGVASGRRVSMGDLAAWLYPRLQLPVLDKTGITGLFDIQIPGLPVRGGSEGTIQAVRNALGLDLELKHGTAETLIIDHADKPKSN
jgi:uncharacterized protein (TIGR03435 family)